MSFLWNFSYAQKFILTKQDTLNLKKDSLPIKQDAQIPSFGLHLSLRQALDTGLFNYASIKSKQNILKSKEEALKFAKSNRLPDLSFTAQQNYGTINASFGPLYSYKGLSSSSSGPVLAEQSWNASFGALYLANIQWDFFAFGKTNEKIKLAYKYLNSSKADLDQEVFEQKVKITAAYFNLLVGQQLLLTQKANLKRATNIQKVVRSRTLSGLNPGVDSSISNAAVSNAKFELINAEQKINELENVLAVSIGISANHFILDTIFTVSIPSELNSSFKNFDLTQSKDSKLGLTPNSLLSNNPGLLYARTQILQQIQNINYLKKTVLPVFTLFDVFQARGSGFGNVYGASNLQDFNQNYFTGISPNRYNYLFGIGFSWNPTQFVQNQHQIQEQQFILKSYKDDFELLKSKLEADLVLSDQRILNSLKQYKEIPIQIKAAKEAYLQKTVLFKNGLTNLVDLSQTFYALNVAETQKAITYNNIWTSLLLKYATLGDFNTFLSFIP